MDIKKLLKTTDRHIKVLNQNGIHTAMDFFMILPRTYENRQEIKTLSQILLDNSIQTIKAKVLKKRIIQTPRGKKLGEVVFEDADGVKSKAQFINSVYPLRNIFVDQRYVIAGKPTFDKGKIFFWHPEFIPSIEDEENFKVGRIYPIYPEMSGIAPSRFARKIWENFDKIDELFPEKYPEQLLQEYDLISLADSIKTLHYPDNDQKLKKAQYRFFFDRLMQIQLISIANKLDYEQNKKIGNTIDIDREIIKEFTSFLPFELTLAQKKSIKHIIEDFHLDKPMMRLLQGDVGSGKTIVALAGAYYISKVFGGQSVFLAPTEVLAQQHIASISKILLPKGFRIGLLTGSTTAKEKEKIKQDLKLGKIDILIGTHAVLQEDVDFHKLRFAIIDEQHKFGVMQRAFFKKFDSPHILQMSATPIPRSLALAFFGEFDVSIIDELPAGRKPIHTKIITQTEFNKLKPWIIGKISAGQQIYIITPLVDESEKMDELSSAIGEFDNIRKFLPELYDQIGLLHGRLRPKEKEDAMKKFKDGKIKVLISTTVIEVGIDVPKATTIIIKDAERFGLSQLHQLRGRVGRNDMQSYCFLITKSKSGETYKRLKAMEQYNDGFKLAEIDLGLRGAGEMLGTRQSGYADIPIEILTDLKFLETVKQASLYLFQKFPESKVVREIRRQISDNSESILI